MPVRKFYLLLLVGWALQSGAATGDTVSESRVQRLGQLEQIQAETVILEAKAARARVQKELEDNGIVATIPTASRLPSVQEIYGTGNRLVARLRWSDGSQAELAAGQRVSGTAFSITHLTAREVRVSDGTHERILPFH